MSAFITTIDPAAKAIECSFNLITNPDKAKEFNRIFPSWDINSTHCDTYRACATNIYRTKDNRWFHLHGNQLLPRRQVTYKYMID